MVKLIFPWYQFAIEIVNQLTFVVHKTYRSIIIPSFEMASHHIVIRIIVIGHHNHRHVSNPYIGPCIMKGQLCARSYVIARKSP